MNETPIIPAAPVESESLADAVATLRVQFQAALIIMIMLSGALDLYLLRQYTSLRKEVAALEPQVGQMLADYQRVSVPLINSFLGKLTEYAKTHPDFQPILTRYNVQAAAPAAAPATPQPAASQPATKAPAPAPAKTAPAAAPKK
jgi:hypothetical protein